MLLSRGSRFVFFKALAKRILKAFDFFGISVLKIIDLRYLPQFFVDLQKWKADGGKISTLHIRLSDYNSVNSGTCSGHYFHQDLLVASLIHRHGPKVHLDVGSRIDGFVAHVASFRKIKVLDIRSLAVDSHPNIEFVRHDLTREYMGGKADSVSCLHAIEHFGLGRYGDAVDVEGAVKGIENLKALVSYGGRLYISCPVAEFSRVEFNAHRVFSPSEIEWLVCASSGFSLLAFHLVDDRGDLHRDCEMSKVVEMGIWYGCGIFIFERT